MLEIFSHTYSLKDLCTVMAWGFGVNETGRVGWGGGSRERYQLSRKISDKMVYRGYKAKAQFSYLSTK